MEKYFIAAMGGAEGFGHRSIERLIKFFGSAKVAWSAEVIDIIKAGVNRRALEAFVNFRNKYPDAPENLVGYCERQKINLCSIVDDDYPPILKEIDTPPMFFYYRGKIQPHAQRIGIVGSRRNTNYGKEVALELAEELAAAGLTVVSGAAHGIDTFAHRGALNSGRTVAVLGCGINYIYPIENRKLFEQIAEEGVVMSEFPPQLPPNAGTFPPRNRIIAGLCRGVIVVEAGKKSGALITSDFALNNNRDVFAIPGKIHAEMSEGCNDLIRSGAILIKSARDVLDEYDIKIGGVKEIQKSVTLNDDEAAVFNVIPADKFITDDEILCELPDMNPNELSSIMIQLGLKGCIEETAGRYKRKNVIVTKAEKKSVALDGVEADVFNLIPADKFITGDEILYALPDMNPNELSDVMIKLELKNCVEEDAGRYKRKF